MSNKDALWQEAKRRFRLSDKHIKMAQQLGLNPKKMGGYASTKNQPWKAPLPQFIETMFAKRFPHSDVAQERNAQQPSRKAKHRQRQKTQSKKIPD